MFVDVMTFVGMTRLLCRIRRYTGTNGAVLTFVRSLLAFLDGGKTNDEPCA